MRILYHHRIAASDGMRVHLTAVVNSLREQGHEVRVVGPGASGERAGRESRLERVASGLRRHLPSAAFEVLELLYNAPAYLRLLSEASAFRPDIIYERYNLFLLAGLLLKRQLRIPMLLEINSPLAAERAEFGHLSLRGVAGWCETALWRGADAVLPVTHVLGERVAAVRRTDSRIFVVPNGANPDHTPSAQAVEAARAALHMPSDALVLGFVGFVRAWHGVDWAVDALAELPPNACVLVVGDGPARGPLQATAAAAGFAGRVHFTGRVPHADVGAYTELFDIALQTASVPYASPLKLFEYMAQGKAILAPDQPNIREILADGQNALLFAPGDPTSFRKALHRLCGDKALRNRLGAAARETVASAPYTWARNAERIGEIGQALLPSTAPDDRAG